MNAKTLIAWTITAASITLAGCGDGGARSTAQPAAPAQHEHGHNHAEGESCPLCAAAAEAAAKEKAAKDAEAKRPQLLDITVNSIAGAPVNLAQFQGQVVMIVNVASRCGFTKQYEGLQSLYGKHKDAGLVILGFPSNDFMGQEPGTNAEIAEFCRANFGVTFPMFEKIAVKGDGAHELFKRLTLAAREMGGEPSWNFTKYLIGRDGKLAARFGPRVSPDAKELTETIDRLLAAKASPKAEGTPAAPK
jgi:glutathione peroxidase